MVQEIKFRVNDRFVYASFTQYLLCTLFLPLIVFSIGVFFYDHSRINGLQGKREGISLTSPYHFHSLRRHLDISQVITERAQLFTQLAAGLETRTFGFPVQVANRQLMGSNFHPVQSSPKKIIFESKRSIVSPLFCSQFYSRECEQIISFALLYGRYFLYFPQF